MFRKILLIFVFVLVFFLTEFFLFDLTEGHFVPQMVLLSVMFFTLSFGIRYGLMTAILSGLIKDSFTIGFFGFHILSFVVCAYLTIVLKKYVYHSHSRFARFFLITLILCVHFFILGLLHYMNTPFHLMDAVRTIFISDLIMTLFVSTFVFRGLKRCVSRFFV